MRTNTTATRALFWAVASCILAACGKESANGTGSNLVDLDPALPPAPQIEISESNYRDVGSSALRTVLLSDASTTAMNQAVTVTRSQEDELANDVASGIDLKFAPISCLNGGSVTLHAIVESTGDDIQVGLNEELALLFNSSFQECDQGGTRLSGSISLDFNAILNNLINNTLYDFHALIDVNDMSIEQQGFFPFYLDGSLSYESSTPDGNTITTRISSNSLRYSADNRYQIEGFESEKVVDLAQQSYSYTLSGSYQEEINGVASTIEYTTHLPLQGNGFALPDSGSIEVYGSGESLFIDVIDQEYVKLSLDTNLDGIAEYEETTTWHDLVLSKLQQPSLPN